MSQDEINNEVQIRLAVQDEKFNAVLARIDATNQRVDDFISEMRDRDNQRHAEMVAINQQNAEIRQSIREIYQTTDAKISEIRQSIDSMGQNVRNVSYTAIAAIGAMVVTVLMNLPKG